MTPEKTQHFKDKLNEEKALVEKELKSVGRINPENPGDWEPTPEAMDTLKADENEVADTIEGFESNTAILKQLEIRYNLIKGALAKIESGTYGKCEVGGEMIEENRLEANPAARTCMAHIKEEVDLN